MKIWELGFDVVLIDCFNYCAITRVITFQIAVPFPQSCVAKGVTHT